MHFTGTVLALHLMEIIHQLNINTQNEKMKMDPREIEEKKEEEMNGDKMKFTYTFQITKAHSIKCMDSLVHPFRHTFIVIFIPCNSSRIKENQITAQLILLPNHKAIEQIKVVKFEPIKYCTHMIKIIIFTTTKKAMMNMPP